MQVKNNKYNWYYFNSAGEMQTGVVTIDGKQYKFNSNGVLVKEKKKTEKKENDSNIFKNKMTVNSAFEVLCNTPVGMKPKKILPTNYKKESLNTENIYSVNKMDDVIKFYDKYYGINMYDKYENSYDYGLTSAEALNKYYGKMLNKLECVTITVKFSRRWNPTVEEINQCCDVEDEYYGHHIHLVDSKSNKSLMTSTCNPTALGKNKGVFVAELYWGYGDKTRFYNEYGENIVLADTGYADITIVKQKDYKDLYLGVSGDALMYLSSNDKKFEKGEISFEKTSWYTQNSDSVRWIKVP